MLAGLHGGHLVHQLLEHFFGKTAVAHFFGWGFICAGILIALVGSSWLKEKKPALPLRRRVIVSLVGGVALVVLGALMIPGNSPVSVDEAVARIQEAGGTVTRDEKVPGRPVVRVDFDGRFRRGADLAYLRRYLASLPEMRHLRISSWAGISDADLVHLEGLTQLKTVELYGGPSSPISQGAVERLRKKLPDAQVHYNGFLF